jgi:hypothetical protein
MRGANLTLNQGQQHLFYIQVCLTCNVILTPSAIPLLLDRAYPGLDRVYPRLDWVRQC